MYFSSLNENVAVNALLYISRQIANAEGKVDKYKLLKILYFAEKIHLAKYGRLITDDDFVAMPHGPVPSFCYDLTKSPVGNPYFNRVDRYSLIPIKEVDYDELSESEIECLDQSIAENKRLSFTALKNKSHDAAYNNTALNRCMDFDQLIKASGASDDLQKYIYLHYSNQRAVR